MGNVIKQEEFITLLRKHNLQYYVGEQQQQRLKYLIDLCSTDLFGLDTLKLQELLMIERYLEKQQMRTKRYRNWTLAGKIVDCKQFIKGTQLYLKPTHHNMKGYIVSCLYQQELDITKVVDKFVYVTGDLYKVDEELVMQVTNIDFKL